MTPIIGQHGGYRRTLSFGFVCLVYHATTTFCRRNFNFHNDSLGKTVGQMVGAARSARQNIVEGSTRAGTSKETELRLLDVAKGSLEELAGDYETYLTDVGQVPWSEQDPRSAKIRAIEFTRFEANGDFRHEFGKHILEMRKRFADEIESEDPIYAANAILVLIDRANALLHKQIKKISEEFQQVGGFRERVTNARLARNGVAQEENDIPKCPKCGSPMIKIIARNGPNAGNPFWSCSSYPNCKGSRPWNI